MNRHYLCVYVGDIGGLVHVKCLMHFSYCNYNKTWMPPPPPCSLHTFGIPIIRVPLINMQILPLILALNKYPAPNISLRWWPLQLLPNLKKLICWISQKLSMNSYCWEVSDKKMVTTGITHMAFSLHKFDNTNAASCVNGDNNKPTKRKL